MIKILGHTPWRRLGYGIAALLACLLLGGGVWLWQQDSPRFAPPLPQAVHRADWLASLAFPAADNTATSGAARPLLQLPAGRDATPPTANAPLPISWDNVDSSSYAALSAWVNDALANLAHDADDGAPVDGLLVWAQLRLANTFEVPAMQARLLAAAARLQRLRPAAQRRALRRLAPVARLALAAALAPAPAPAAWLQGTQHLPQALYIQAERLATKQPWRAINLLKSVVRRAPHFDDAWLLYGELSFDAAQIDASVAAWQRFIRRGDPDNIWRLATFLLQQGSSAPLATLLAALGDGSRIAAAAPAHQDRLWALLLRHNLQQAKLPEALQLALRRVIAQPPAELPAPLHAYTELCQLADLLHWDSRAIWQQAWQQYSGTAAPQVAAQAELLFTKLQLTPAAQANDTTLLQLQALPSASAAGWPQLAAAYRSEAQGQLRLAATLYQEAAAAGRPQAQSALLRLQMAAAPRAAAPRQALQAWASQTHEPQAYLALAPYLSKQEKFASNAQQLALALYGEPLPTPLLPALTQWIEALSRSGAAPQAESLAAQLCEAFRCTLPLAPGTPEAAGEPSQRATLLNLWVEMMRHNQHFEAAIATLQQVLQRTPGPQSASLLLAHVYIDAKQHSAARRLLNTLREAPGTLPQAALLFALGRAYADADLLLANQLLHASLAAQPQLQTYIFLGDLAESHHLCADAANAYRAALRLDEAQLALRLRLAALLKRCDDLPGSIEALQDVLQSTPDDAEVAQQLGDAWQTQKNYAAAAAAYAQASQSTPSVALLLKLARLQVQRLGQSQAALQTLQTALQQEPQNAVLHYWRGMAWRNLGARAAARQEFQHSLHLAARDATQTNLATAAASALRHLRRFSLPPPQH